MNKLEKLYNIIQYSKDTGVKLGADVLRQVEELEEQIIKKEILPALSQDIAPRLEPIKRDLILVVEYHAGEPIKVALSRSIKISEINDAKTLTPKISKPVKSAEKASHPIEPNAPSKHIENKTQGMKVTFPDGTIICRSTAIETFIEVLDKIGFKKVNAVGLIHSGCELVSKKKRPPKPGTVWQHECKGWYVYSNISNAQKAKDLQHISDFYHLALKIESGKPAPR